MAAVAAHKAWYRNHGFKDNVIVASRVILTDQKTGTMKYSDTEVVTYHVNPPGSATPKGDAAWDAYVKMYREIRRACRSKRSPPGPRKGS